MSQCTTHWAVNGVKHFCKKRPDHWFSHECACRAEMKK